MAPRGIARAAATITALVVLGAGCSGSASDDATPGGAAEAVSTDDVITAEATRSRDGDTTVLSSPDTFGATVSVPDSALGDVDADDLTLDVVAVDDTDAEAAAIAFVLGPDGAEFAEPVLLEWDGPWSADAEFALSAATDGGEPLEDEQSTTSNSIAALRVEPTSATTAHYTLPVDHFSVWTVYFGVKMFGVELTLSASGETPQPIPVAQPTTVNVTLDTENWYGTQMCLNAIVAGIEGPVRAHFAAQPAECLVVKNANLGLNRALTIECTSVGTATVSVTLYGLVVLNTGDLDESRLAKLRALMFSSAFDLGDDRTSVSYDDGSAKISGGMAAARVSLPITCIEAGSATSTTVSGSTTSVPRTTTTAARSGATTTTTAARSGATTTTTARPSTTSPPATSAPTTTTTTTAPPASGTPGQWAFNDFDHCDWNGTGGCGWYWGDDPGEYWMGPIGCPGMSISAVGTTNFRITGC